MIEPSGPESRPRGPRPAAMLALVLIAGVVGAASAAGVTLGILHFQARTNPQTVDLGSRVTITEESAIVKVAATALPAVVSVVTGGTPSAPAYGSGFIVTSDGDVVTSADILAHATRLSVLVRGDPKPHNARLLDFDCQTGVAVLRMDSVSSLPTLTFGSSAALKPGQTVISLGGPLGGQQAVTRGIVSALGASTAVPDPITGSGTQSFHDTIETDTVISAVSAGGPLLNVDGQVVGVSMSDAASTSPGGFALAADDVQPEVQQIVQTGQLEVPLLGAEGVELSSAMAGLRGLPAGLLVQTVTAAGPAAQAGIKVGDLVTQIDGVPIDAGHPLASVLASHFQRQERVSVTVYRHGGTTQVSLTLGGGHPACR
ncbi:MAG: S1C family serine protease [Candidatus Dormibacterales bacterium]